MDQPPNILILCTGNSCRSQMAEGFLRELAGDRFNVLSAGTQPAERVHPLAVEVMREEGIDLSDHRPKDLKNYLGKTPVRYLIVVCDGANETCPRVWPGMHERLFWPFADPAAFKGSPEETIAEFRRVRNEIKQRIQTWLAHTGE